MRRQLSLSQEEGLYQKLNLLEHYLGFPASRTLRGKCLMFKPPNKHTRKAQERVLSERRGRKQLFGEITAKTSPTG